MAVSPEIIRCTAGEKLEPFTYTYTEADDDVIDLTGYSGKVTWLRHTDSSTGVFDVDSIAAPSGAVTFIVPPSVTDAAGAVDLQVWVGNGTYLFASNKRWRLVIAEAVGTAPSI